MKSNTYTRKALSTNSGNGYPMPDVGKPYKGPVMLTCNECGRYIKADQGRAIIDGKLTHTTH
jgi:hypothetical protein